MDRGGKRGQFPTAAQPGPGASLPRVSSTYLTSIRCENMMLSSPLCDRLQASAWTTSLQAGRQHISVRRTRRLESGTPCRHRGRPGPLPCRCSLLLVFHDAIAMRHTRAGQKRCPLLSRCRRAKRTTTLWGRRVRSTPQHGHQCAGLGVCPRALT